MIFRGGGSGPPITPSGSAHGLMCKLPGRVKSGKFGHQVNSDTHLCANQDETAPYEPSHHEFHFLLR